MTDLLFDPGDDRSIDRKAYYHDRKMARLFVRLYAPSSLSRRRCWDDLVHQLSCWPGATPEGVALLQENAIEAGRTTTVSAQAYLVASAARYFSGNRFCTVCNHLAPLRDGECPDCCH